RSSSVGVCGWEGAEARPCAGAEGAAPATAPLARLAMAAIPQKAKPLFMRSTLRRTPRSASARPMSRRSAGEPVLTGILGPLGAKLNPKGESFRATGWAVVRDEHPTSLGDMVPAGKPLHSELPM